MLELLKSLVFAEVFNLFSGAGHKDSRPQNH